MKDERPSLTECELREYRERLHGSTEVALETLRQELRLFGRLVGRHEPFASVRRFLLWLARS